ncbi:hypothetical protein D030_3398A, partial [Vibrio parahaemolyticus AQ3810]
MLRLIL